ncbi:MAG TPA: hypothetical protein PLP39_05850 [Flavobacterium lutivivi]|nr:hypothetical protein [Flavobacterium lutivivi]
MKQTLYEQEIERISNIESEYKKLSGEQLRSFLYETCGITLLSIQKTEFILQGIVSHFNQDLLERNKNFKNLTPRAFLDNDDDSKKKRKQTLGTILRFLTDSTDLFEYEELSEYIGKRNLFIHSFWRDFLSNGRSSKQEEIYNTLSFTIELLKLDIKWQHIFQGMLFEFAKTIAENHNRDLTAFDNLKTYQNDFLEYIHRKHIS